MYLRWRKRERQTPRFGSIAAAPGYAPSGRLISHRATADGQIGPDVHWSATILENKRVNGKPRQQHVAYLGGIVESAIGEPCHRGLFWEKITARLDSLGNRVPGADRQAIEAAVAMKVPPITPEQMEECRRGREQMRAALRAMFKR